MNQTLKSCRHCGEGVTTHCRAPVEVTCPDGLPPMPRATTKAMDSLSKAIHGNPRFTFEGACEAVNEAARVWQLKKARE